MIPYTLKRLAGLAITLVVASFVVYSSVFISPGSPETVLYGNRQPSPEVRAELRAHLGLDQSFSTRYFRWLQDIVTGDLGTSVISQQAVSERIAQPASITVALVAYAAVLIVLIGVGAGLLSALKPGPVDAAVTGLVSLATAVPAFVASSLLISVFAVGLGWFPNYGLGNGAMGWIHSLTLPAVSLAVISSGLVARVTRAAARAQSASDHVQTAISRGISGPRLIAHHIVRNAAGTIITVTGLQIAGLLASAVVVEQAFGLGGMGQLLLSSVQQKDFPVVQSISLLLVFAFVLLNLAADLTAASVDPHMRTWRTA